MTGEELHNSSPKLHNSSPELHSSSPELHSSSPNLHSSSPNLHNSPPALAGPGTQQIPFGASLLYPDTLAGVTRGDLGVRRGGMSWGSPARAGAAVPVAAPPLLPAQPSSLSVLIKWDRNTDLALLHEKSTGRWLLSRALLLQQPDWREGGRRRISLD